LNWLVSTLLSGLFYYIINSVIQNNDYRGKRREILGELFGLVGKRNTSRSLKLIKRTIKISDRLENTAYNFLDTDNSRGDVDPIIKTCLNVTTFEVYHEL